MAESFLPEEKPDAPIIIVGGGLSGTLLAARMVHGGQAVIQFDRPDPHAASRVAAGLFNTFTGRKGALTWQAAMLLDELDAFFGLPWMQRHGSFMHKRPVYRPFRSAQEFNEGCEYADRIPQFVSLVQAPQQERWVSNPWGGLLVPRTGWVDVPGLIDSLRADLLASSKYWLYPEALEYAAIACAQSQAWIAGELMPYAAIVFAEGPHAVQNPWWPASKDIRPLKGQILRANLPVDLPFTLVNKVYLAQRDNGDFWVGSTYEPSFSAAEPDEAGANEILQHMQNACTADAMEQLALSGHYAGIRPTSPDRRPILGKHPQLPFYFLNGMGTKGVLQAPWCTRILWEHIQDADTALPPEVRWDRWKS